MIPTKEGPSHDSCALGLNSFIRPLSETLPLLSLSLPPFPSLPQGHFQQKVFQLDFNRHTGEYRMIDNFHVNSVTGIDALIKQTKSTPIHEFNSAAFKGAWPAEVACLRTCWHPSLLRASLLATGTAAGLVRIDWVEGGELAT